MSNYTLMLVLNGAASTILAIAMLHRRWMLLKPSIAFAGYYQLSVMWPGLPWFGYVEEVVPNVREYVWAIHGTGLAVTLAAVLSWQGTASRMARRLFRRAPPGENSYRFISLLVLGSFVLIVTLWYLRELGWANTGLGAILSGSEDNAQSREAAMKLLGNRGLQYAWAFMASAAAYLLGYWLAFSTLDLLRTRRPFPALLCLLGYLALLVVVMLPGARAPAAMLVLATLVAFYIRSGFRVRLSRIALILGLALALPAVLTLWRNNEAITLQSFGIYYADILDRVAGRSVQDNIWLVSYVQKEGFFGHQGIPLFSRLTGGEPLNVFNLVGLYFKPDGLESISANSSSIAVNYGCYGLPGSFLLSIVMTLGIDSLMLLQARLPAALLAPCTGICAVVSLNFAMTLFTTVFVTHGLLPTIALCFMIHFLVNSSRRRAPLPHSSSAPGDPPLRADPSLPCP